jgi:hypothetical protein
VPAITLGEESLVSEGGADVVGLELAKVDNRFSILLAYSLTNCSEPSTSNSFVEILMRILAEFSMI